jgi:hypothetical protein
VVDEVDRVLQVQLRLLENLLRKRPPGATQKRSRESKTESEPVEAEMKGPALIQFKFYKNLGMDRNVQFFID